MSEREDRLAAVYDEHAPRVHAYALRHCGPDGADDVLAEVFAVARRRLDVLPDPPIGWLIVTARHVVAGRRRSERRQLHLARLYADQPLREAAPDRSPDRAQDLRSAVLARAVAAAPARRWRAVAGGLTAAVLGLGAVGGVAYATGGVPTMFSGPVDDFGRDNGVPAAERPELAGHRAVQRHRPGHRPHAAGGGRLVRRGAPGHQRRALGRRRDPRERLTLEFLAADGTVLRTAAGPPV